MKITPEAEHGHEQELYLLLTNLSLLLDDTDRRFFGEFGLSTRQFWALHHLSKAGGLSMIELSRLLLTDKSNVTAITDRLETAGFVKRGQAPQDRRVILLTLTPAGRQMHDHVLAAHEERIRTLIAGDEATLRQLLQVLESIRGRFERYLHAQISPVSTSHTAPASEQAEA